MEELLKDLYKLKLLFLGYDEHWPASEIEDLLKKYGK
jgi:hypothetical protein